MRYTKGNYSLTPNIDALKGQPPALLAVYFWICKHANEDGICFPSRSTLADEAGVSIDTVDRQIKALEELGFLSKEVRKKGKENHSNLYQINLIETRGVAAPDTLPSRTPPTTPSRTRPTVTISSINYIQEDDAPASSQSEEDSEILPEDGEGNLIIKKPSKKKSGALSITDFAARAAAIRQKKLHPHFDFDEQLGKLQQSGYKPDKIVAHVWHVKHLTFENWDQFNSNLGRDRKLAQALVGYSGKEIAATISVCEKDAAKNGYEWGVATVAKKIANVVNKK